MKTTTHHFGKKDAYGELSADQQRLMGEAFEAGEKGACALMSAVVKTIKHAELACLIEGRTDFADLFMSGSVIATAVLGSVTPQLSSTFQVAVHKAMASDETLEQSRDYMIKDLTAFVEACMSALLQADIHEDIVADAKANRNMSELDVEQFVNGIRREVAAHFNVTLRPGTIKAGV